MNLLRKKFPLILALSLSAAIVWADPFPVALVYSNEKAVLDNQSFLAPLTPEGVLVSSKFALEVQASALVGMPGNTLRQSHLLKLDTIADAAILEIGEEVADPKLQSAFKARADALLKFLPTDVSSSSFQALQLATLDPFFSNESFFFKVHGVLVSSGVAVQLPTKNKKSEVKLKVVRGRKEAVWRATVEITSEPSMLFWKKGREKTLINVPEKKFSYTHQAMFTALEGGRSFTIPIELSSIKDKFAEWTIKVKSKDGIYEKKISFVFE